MTCRVTIDNWCPLCFGFHRAEVLSWSEDGYPLDVRDLEPCPRLSAFTNGGTS